MHIAYTAYTINTDLLTLQQPTQQEAATRCVSDQRNAIFFNHGSNTRLFKRPEFSLTPLASVNDCADSSAFAGPEAVGSARFSPSSALFYTVSYSGIA